MTARGGQLATIALVRAVTGAKILAIAAFLAAAGLALAALVSFRAALSARLDRAEDLHAVVVRPTAAARLSAALLERRLALVSEKESHAVAGAFRRAAAAEAVESYRRAGGDPKLVEEARRALEADISPDAAGDVALLRAIRGLRADAARAPSPSRPEPPASARKAGSLLLWSGAAAAAAALLAYTAGKLGTRPPPEP